MKRFCAIIVLIIIGCFTSFNSFAQKRTIKAKLHKEEVEGVSREGAAIEIDLNNKSIVKEWESTLKTYGKLTKLKGDAYKVTEATFPGVTGTCVIYSKCYSSSKGYLAWWSIDNGTHITSNSKHSESKLEEFARQQYINDINEQVKDAESAVKSAAKVQEKQVDKGADLVKDISKNGQEKTKLEQELKDNAAELQQLNKDVETNKGDQKKAADEVAKM
ncbi:MAG: ATPase involved in repair, partial [Chitinophagaceae bacterium]|nr:ATPase involved in repair [Chitinophagaceae bacterium]